MRKESSEEATFVETEHRKLGYATEFKTFVKENPGFLKNTRELIAKAEKDYSPGILHIGDIESRWVGPKGFWEVFREKGDLLEKPFPLSQHRRFSMSRTAFFMPGINYVDSSNTTEVKILGKFYREWPDRRGIPGRIDQTTYAKVGHNGKYFFVKKSPITIMPGFREFTNTMKAKSVLQNIDYVKVIEAQLGYQDATQSWFVSRWELLEKAGFGPVSQQGGTTGRDDYAQPIDSPDTLQFGYDYKLLDTFSEEEKERRSKALRTERLLMLDREDMILQTLKGAGIFTQDLESNIFYNPTSHTFILLDLAAPETTKPGSN